MYSILFILINYYMKSFNEVYNLFIKCNKVFQKMDLVVSLSQEGGQPWTQFGPTGRITHNFWTVYASSPASTYTPNQWEIPGKFYNKNCG